MIKISNDSLPFPLILLGIWALLRSTFYEYNGIEPYFQVIVSLDKVFTLLIVMFCLPEINFRYDKYTALIAYGFFITILVNVIFQQSNIQQEFTGFAPIFGFYSFFLMCKFDVQNDKIEKFLLFFAFLYFCIWSIAIYNIPKLIFGQNLSGDLSNMDRGFFRLWIPDKEHFPILLFFFLSRFLLNKKNLYALLAFLVLIVIILHVGRQMISWSIISALIMILVILKEHRIHLLFGIVILYVIGNWLFENIEGLSLMLNMTQKQTAVMDDDIRVLAIKHFIFDFPNNYLTMIFGNGIPCEGTNLRTCIDFAFNRGFFLEDVGFVGMYIRYGLWMVVLMFLILIKILCLSVENRYIYLKFYIVYIYGMYLFGHALTTDIFYVMIAYYILLKSHIEIKYQYNNESVIC